MHVVSLLSLLAAFWGARGEPPGLDVTRLHAQDKVDAVQGLKYFATGTSSILPHQLLVYPGSAHILIPAQVGQQAAIPVPGYGTQPAQVLPVPAYGSSQLPVHAYGGMQQTSVLYGSTHQLPHGSGVLQQGGTVLQYGGAVPQYGGGVLQQGGRVLPQSGVYQVPFPGNQQAANVPTSTPYPSTQHTILPGVEYTVTQPATSSTPYGTQPPRPIYQEGVRPLPPGFLYPSQPSVTHTAPSQFQDNNSHANIDLTYDSLGSSSSSHSDNIAHNLVSHMAPVSTITSSPPLKPTMYGPPRPLYMRYRRPSHVMDAPHYHPVHKGVISPYYHYHHPHGSHRHPQTTVVLKPHAYQLASLHKHATAAIDQQQFYHTPQSIYSPTFTKPIYYPQSLLGNYAPTHGYHLISKTDMDSTNGHDIGSGEAMNHQDDTASNGYSTIVGTFYDDSSLPHHAVKKTPVIVYKGVRPPVRFYQKPELMSKHLQAMHYYPTHHIDRADAGDNSVVASAEHEKPPSSTLAPFEPNWMPINAPEGAMPAKAYEMMAPDLSASRGNHHTQPQKGEGVKSQVSSPTLDHPLEKYYNQRSHDEIRAGEVYKGNSEEVVSAVVMVKQR